MLLCQFLQGLRFCLIIILQLIKMSLGNGVNPRSQQIYDEQQESIMYNGKQNNTEKGSDNLDRRQIVEQAKSGFKSCMKNIDRILLTLLVLWIGLFAMYVLSTKNQCDCPEIIKQNERSQKQGFSNLNHQKTPKNLQSQKTALINNPEDSDGITMQGILKKLKDQPDTWTMTDENSKDHPLQTQEIQGNELTTSTFFDSPNYTDIKNKMQRKQEKHKERGEKFQKWQLISKFEAVQYAKYNLQSHLYDVQGRQALQEQQRKSLEAKYSISQYQKELSICTIVYATPTSKEYSHEYVLTSILHQNYVNHKIVYIANGHNAEQISQIKEFINEKNMFQQNIILIWNAKAQHYLQSIMVGIKNHCLHSNIVALVRGSDELLGRYVYKTFNSIYKAHDSKIVYSNSVKYRPKVDRMESGQSQSYQLEQKNKNSYRNTYQKYGRLFTFWTKLFTYIKQDDLKDKKGYFYQQGGEDALIYSLLQLACGQVQFLPEYNYFQYDEEMSEASTKILKEDIDSIKQRTRYSCYRKYE